MFWLVYSCLCILNWNMRKYHCMNITCHFVLICDFVWAWTALWFGVALCQLGRTAAYLLCLWVVWSDERTLKVNDWALLRRGPLWMKRESFGCRVFICRLNKHAGTSTDKIVQTKRLLNDGFCFCFFLFF